MNSAVNKLTIHRAEGADGKAMVGHTDPPVSLKAQEGREALECHLQEGKHNGEAKNNEQTRPTDH